MTSSAVLDFRSLADRLNFRPIAARLEQEIGKINYSEIDTTRVTPGADALGKGRPIGFSWGRSTSGVQRLEFGYLTGNSDETIRDGSRIINKVTLKIMGAGFAMSDKRSRTWNGLTIPWVISSIAREHRLNVVVDEHAVQWAEISQSAESDWAFICRLAKQIGWWVYLDTTTLYVLDPDKIISRFTAVAIDVEGSGQFRQHTDDSPLMGARRRVDRRAVATIDGQRHTFISDRVPVTGPKVEPASLVEEIEVEAASYAEAQALFDGIERNSAWYVERTMTMPGQPEVRPLQPVVVRTPRVVQAGVKDPQQGWEQYDGIWVVKSVENVLKFGRAPTFTSEVTLVRDALGPKQNIRQRRPADMRTFERQPPTRTLDNRWVASWSNGS